LLPLLNDKMLVLCDRGFDSDDFAAELAGTGARFLIRATAARNPPVLARLSDGSFLSRLGALPVRIIDVDVVVTLADGTRHAERYRLITSLLDARCDPASALVRLYHERWEVETALHGLRQGLLHGHQLRSEDRFGIEQEMWALLCLYQLLRCAMVNATDTIKGSDPDRASFACAVDAARDQVVLAAGIQPTTSDDGRLDLVGEIGRAVLADLNPPRRLRISARKVKSSRSRYASRPPGEWRPAASTPITGITAAIHQAPEPPAPPDTPDQPHPGRTARRDQVMAFLAANGDQPWTARHIAHALGVTERLNSFCVQLSTWARYGHFTKTAPATYTINQTP
ncbi:transposase, partial [Catenulispora sp. EB89]|uniref:transposase n=1 Tax=Catenulispora sp. EB89 TaxID=3156257 RepID=UPI003518C6ED